MKTGKEEMLSLIGKKREDVFIGNVLKCRPPGNRDPMPEEVAACWPWMMDQIEMIRPKLIVLLGRHAMERFLPNQKISKIHGQAMRREIPEIGRQVFYVLYHPAAALYQGSLREILKADFKKIPKVIEAIEKGKKGDLGDEGNEVEKEEKNRFEEEDKQEALF
ncbi:MAG: Phage SPO1 DNA polymerase-related protein [Candidatus Moranbacteria bacterium GW2011_GWF1_44_4]|nr:MAG: Phage SPO1 DNA polymerase-related protein [Candidatus Moranbacteria bacterium GW2011_GWF1_44_4]